jgi:hypothetical protein
MSRPDESDEAQVQQDFVVRECPLETVGDEEAQVVHDRRLDEAESDPETDQKCQVGLIAAITAHGAPRSDSTYHHFEPSG